MTATAPSEGSGVRPMIGSHAKVAEKVRGDLLDFAGRFRRAVDGDRGPVEAPEADDLGDDLVVRANGIERRSIETRSGFLEARPA